MSNVVFDGVFEFMCKTSLLLKYLIDFLMFCSLSIINSTSIKNMKFVVDRFLEAVRWKFFSFLVSVQFFWLACSLSLVGGICTLEERTRITNWEQEKMKYPIVDRFLFFLFPLHTSCSSSIEVTNEEQTFNWRSNIFRTIQLSWSVDREIMEMKQ